ncbi:DUF4159 domain-containing protein [Tundrisphaera lichenicola]|uniref:DUF4159 domain-containing protein n=1 Tax=Tundrisphaera lichenicola TaxID=2029860 RepID=UPI003EC0E465
MTRRRLSLVLIPLVLMVVAGATLGQMRFRRGGGGGQVEIPDDRAGVPNWEVDSRFKSDVFTFVRVEYDSMGGGRGRRGGFGGYGGYGGWDRWAIDFPDSDLNFSYRLQQLTSLKVSPDPIHLRLTDEKLFDYPFIYIIEPGALVFSEEEVIALRRYLLNGGFLMVDDFWGDYEYDNFYREIKRVFPDREPRELPLGHEVFQCVYRLKEKPQVPSIQAAMYGRGEGITWEEGHGGNTRDVHYRGIEDDKGRLMALICHNTDLGDGWEREGEDPWYFKEFSEKKAYPMGINIITYVMTH